MSSIICTMPACQTSAGCVCGRTTYTPPFSPTVVDTYWADEIKTLNEKIDRLTRELAEAKKDRDYWKIEAEGERAKVAFRDKKFAEARDKALEEAAEVALAQIDELGITENPASVRYQPSHAMARKIAGLVRALKEKP